MRELVSRIRAWVGLDEKSTTEVVPQEELARAEDEGMTPPDVETPSPQLEDTTT